VKIILLFIAVFVTAIGGCYAFWLWLRLNRSPVWSIAGVASLVVFARLLTRVDIAFAGRAYAAYGGIYISLALLWLWWIEGAKPDRCDLICVSVCLIGASIILFGPRYS